MFVSSDLAVELLQFLQVPGGHPDIGDLVEPRVVQHIAVHLRFALIRRRAGRELDWLRQFIRRVAIRQSDLDWVIVRPATLTDGPKTGTYRAGIPLPMGLNAKIARADVADFMLKQVEAEEFVRKKPSIGPLA